MVKVIFLFLLAMVLIALISNLIAPGRGWRRLGRALGLPLCPDCGQLSLGPAHKCRGRG